MIRRVVFAVPFVFVVASFGPAQEKPVPPKGERVFVCGHSFHAFIAGPLGEMAKASGIESHTLAGSQFLGGSRVQQHWDLADEKNKAKKALKDGKVDVLTLSPHVLLPDAGIDKYTELGLETNPKLRVLVQASWYPFDTPQNNARTFKNEDRDTAKIEDLRKAYEPFYAAVSKQVTTLNAKVSSKAEQPVVALVPVGHAVLALREKVAAGQVPGITKQSDLFGDGIGHPKPPVAVLVAYCYYTAVYRLSPVGLKVPNLWPPVGNPAYDDKLDRLLQEIAWEAVTNEKLSCVTK